MLLLFLFTLFGPGYVSISHGFILSRCSRAVLTWAQLAGGLFGVERDTERERATRSVHLLSAICEMYVL